MPQAWLGKKGAAPLELSSSETLIAVRTRSRSSLRAGPVQPRAASAIADAQLVSAFPEAGVEVYRIGDSRHSLDRRKALLRRHPDVRFAAAVLVDTAGEPVLYTENVLGRARQ
jgi:hypothetical protein